jgi:hypothetical protein
MHHPCSRDPANTDAILLNCLPSYYWILHPFSVLNIPFSYTVMLAIGRPMRRTDAVHSQRRLTHQSPLDLILHRRPHHSFLPPPTRRRLWARAASAEPKKVLVELEGVLRVMPNKDGGRILLDTGEVAGVVRPGAADGVLTAFHFFTHPMLPLPCSTAPPYPPSSPRKEHAAAPAEELATARRSARDLEPAPPLPVASRLLALRARRGRAVPPRGGRRFREPHAPMTTPPAAPSPACGGAPGRRRCCKCIT